MKRYLFLILFVASMRSASAQQRGIFGQWTEPTGSTIEVYRCGADACARIVGISKQAPTTMDEKNPSVSLRTRSLCGLQIGSSFHLVDENHAIEGQLYDPKSGNIYSGSMTGEGDSLKLRGYIKIKLFGRTQAWTRARAETSSCHRVESPAR
jgi:uncharacterized protein (DUF2147 family)